jgi:hypothetical protein
MDLRFYAQAVDTVSKPWPETRNDDQIRDDRDYLFLFMVEEIFFSTDMVKIAKTRAIRFLSHFFMYFCVFFGVGLSVFTTY